MTEYNLDKHWTSKGCAECILVWVCSRFKVHCYLWAKPLNRRGSEGNLPGSGVQGVEPQVSLEFLFGLMLLGRKCIEIRILENWPCFDRCLDPYLKLVLWQFCDSLETALWEFRQYSYIEVNNLSHPRPMAETSGCVTLGR